LVLPTGKIFLRRAKVSTEPAFMLTKGGENVTAVHAGAASFEERRARRGLAQSHYCKRKAVVALKLPTGNSQSTTLQESQ
jgi:hypothetical protein